MICCSHLGHVVLAGLDSGPEPRLTVRRRAAARGRGRRRAYPLLQPSSGMNLFLQPGGVLFLPRVQGHQSPGLSVICGGVSPPGLHLPDIQVLQDCEEQRVKGAEVYRALLG